MTPDLIFNYIDNSHKVAGILLDVSKAFDSLDHNIHLQTLNANGFRVPIFSWLQSFIVDRYQCVVHNGVQSSFIKKCMYGIAQRMYGIAPRTFNVFITL